MARMGVTNVISNFRKTFIEVRRVRSPITVKLSLIAHIAKNAYAFKLLANAIESIGVLTVLVSYLKNFQWPTKFVTTDEGRKSKCLVLEIKYFEKSQLAL